MKKEQIRDDFQRKRAERQRKIRKRRLTAFFIFFMITLLCIGIVLSYTVLFPIKNITAQGSKIYSEDEIVKISGINIEDNLFAVSKSSTEKQLKKNLPYVESITFKRTLPDTLKIVVKDAEEFACYKIKNRYFVVSESGWVLAEKSKAPQKIFTVSAKDVECKVGSEIKFGDNSQRELVKSISDSLSGENISVNSIDVTQVLELKAKVEGRFTVNFGNSNNLKEKVAHLSGMIKEIPKEKRGKIDLSMWTSDKTKGTFIAQN